MTVEEVASKLGLKCIVGEKALHKEVEGAYVGDLLSCVMANAKEKQIWITVQGHINVIAVAVLVGIPAVILAQGTVPSEEMKVKADEEQVAILMSKQSSYEIAKVLAKWL